MWEVLSINQEFGQNPFRGSSSLRLHSITHGAFAFKPAPSIGKNLVGEKTY